MSVEKTRAHLVGSIWQALAKSGVDLSTMPQEDQVKLVNKIADHVLISVNDLLEDMQPAAEKVMTEGDETILWEGRPFLSLVEKYTLTNERIKVIRGMVSRDVENYELVRIQDIDLSQNLSERMMGIGDITIRGADSSEPTIVIRNISDPEKVYEIMRRAWLEARKKHGLQFREYM
ncbi:MAG: PH domain-containing protein [Anaerolineales bacterium]|jgi:hypothetical protein|nr:PH domain-containing protein [Anaerolineales bacterium]